MKNILIILFATALFSLNVNAQKVYKVTISAKASISEVLDACKEAGKKRGCGSKDYDTVKGTLTLWAGDFLNNSFLVYVSAVNKDGITTFTLKCPHHSGSIGNYKAGLRLIVNKIDLPEMMMGEYTDEIE